MDSSYFQGLEIWILNFSSSLADGGSCRIFYAGIKAYDIVAGSQLLKKSYILSKSKALELFPMLKSNQLVGALVYYDGSFES